MMGGMNAIMNVSALQTIEQVETFLTAAATVEFRFEDIPAGYAWIQATLAMPRCPDRTRGSCVVICGR